MHIFGQVRRLALIPMFCLTTKPRSRKKQTTTWTKSCSPRIQGTSPEPSPIWSLIVVIGSFSPALSVLWCPALWSI